MANFDQLFKLFGDTVNYDEPQQDKAAQAAEQDERNAEYFCGEFGDDGLVSALYKTPSGKFFVLRWNSREYVSLKEAKEYCAKNNPAYSFDELNKDDRTAGHYSAE